MNRLLILAASALLSVCAFAQTPRPKLFPLPTVPPAVGTQERTQFFSDAQKTKLCATLVEREGDYWYVYPVAGEVSPAFHTRAGHSNEGRSEAVSWANHYCSVTK